METALTFEEIEMVEGFSTLKTCDNCHHIVDGGCVVVDDELTFCSDGCMIDFFSRESIGENKCNWCLKELGENRIVLENLLISGEFCSYTCARDACEESFISIEDVL